MRQAVGLNNWYKWLFFYLRLIKILLRKLLTECQGVFDFRVTIILLHILGERLGKKPVC